MWFGASLTTSPLPCPNDGGQEETLRHSLILNLSLILLSSACAATGSPEKASVAVTATNEQFLLTYPNLADPDGEVLLENELVVVQRFVVGPGEWEGIHSHPGNQVFVHVKGGQWSGRRGGKATSGATREDGAVGWMAPIPLSDGHESGNTGDNPIDLIWVTLKKNKRVTPDGTKVLLTYPNLANPNGQVLIDNERVVVQRFVLRPGEWEGIHSHPGNQVYIHIKGGIWSGRRGGVQSEPSPFSETGSVGWSDAVPLSAQHESGNTGDTTIDLIWVTLK